MFERIYILKPIILGYLYMLNFRGVVLVLVLVDSPTVPKMEESSPIQAVWIRLM